MSAYSDVLEARAGRVAMGRDFLGTVTAAELDAPRTNPHRPAGDHQVLPARDPRRRLGHYRFAMRDLDTIEAGRS